ncbi:MAG: FAD-dependent oxidoreductase [Acidobacteria bacterium]|nr:FAD-dependent oxidoreductase [Acidobacteriota bacterium]
MVIGAGFAGLAAATALAEAGVRVHVLEARPGLGGRAATFRDPATGERIDNGQHVLAGCYTETLRFLRRIGSQTLLHWPSSLRVPMIDEGGRRSELALPPLPPPFHLLAAVLAWDALTMADRVAMLRIGRGLRGQLRVDPRETVRQWLVRHQQSPRLCRLLWEPLALAALNQSIDDAAAESFVAVTSRMFGSDPDAATLLLPAVPLDELYVHPSRRYLESAGSVVAANSPAHVLFADGRVSGVRVRDDVTPARLVISSVPWFAFEELCAGPPSPLTAIAANAAALGSAPIVTVNLWFEDFICDVPLLGLPGRTFQWVFDRRQITGPACTHLSLVSSGADAICAAPNDDLIKTALEEIGAAWPAARRATVRHAAVVREKRATFSLKPGSPPRPPTVTPVPGLLLAGDWIATGLPATIESAVTSGHRAARAALDTLCLPS